MLYILCPVVSLLRKQPRNVTNIIELKVFHTFLKSSFVSTAQETLLWSYSFVLVTYWLFVLVTQRKKKLSGTVLLEYKTKIITPESLPTRGTLRQTEIKTHQAPAWHGLRWYQQPTSEHTEVALKGDTVTWSCRLTRKIQAFERDYSVEINEHRCHQFIWN